MIAHYVVDGNEKARYTQSTKKKDQTPTVWRNTLPGMRSLRGLTKIGFSASLVRVRKFFYRVSRMPFLFNFCTAFFDHSSPS
jgi:hypothetical protein